MNLSTLGKQQITSLETLVNLKDVTHQKGVVKIAGSVQDRRVYASATHRPAMAWIKSAFLSELRAKNREIKTVLLRTATLGFREGTISAETLTCFRKAINPKFGTPLSVAKLRKLVQQVANQSIAKSMDQFNAKEKTAIKFAKFLRHIGMSGTAQKLARAVEQGTFQGQLTRAEQREVNQFRINIGERNDQTFVEPEFEDDDILREVVRDAPDRQEEPPPEPPRTQVRQEPLSPMERVIRQLKERNANSNGNPKVFLKPVESGPTHEPVPLSDSGLRNPEWDPVSSQEGSSNLIDPEVSYDNEGSEELEDRFDEESLQKLVRVLSAYDPKDAPVITPVTYSLEQLVNNIREVDDDGSLVHVEEGSEGAVEDVIEEPTKPLTPEQIEDIEVREGLANWLKRTTPNKSRKASRHFSTSEVERRALGVKRLLVGCREEDLLGPVPKHLPY